MLNDIEDCPATLLSANRHFVSKCDARLLMQSENATKHIYKLDTYVFSLLLFTDLIVVSTSLLVYFLVYKNLFF